MVLWLTPGRDQSVVVLRSPKKRNDSFFGFVEKDNKATKVPRRGKYALTKEEYPGDQYPPWAHGPCYVLTIDVAAWVATTMKVDTRLKLEDVSMGIWLSKKPGGVNIVHNRLFNYFGCFNNDISSHNMWPAKLVCSYHKSHCCSLTETRRLAANSPGLELLKKEEWQVSTLKSSDFSFFDDLYRIQNQIALHHPSAFKEYLDRQ